MRGESLQQHASADAMKSGLKVETSSIAGVPVKIVSPAAIPTDKRSRVLINVHGGGFVADFGSSTETIPIASLTRTRVIAVLYRLAPEHPFPAAVDDVVAVYRVVLKMYGPRNIAIYGTSSGAVITAEVAARLHRDGLPSPAALGIFSGSGDFTRDGDTYSIYGLRGLSGVPLPRRASVSGVAGYVGTTDAHDPALSPLFGDLHGFPPTLFLSSTRDLFLSGTAILHRAFRKAGVPAELVLFEGLPHAFWSAAPANLPETLEANHVIAAFFDQHVGARKR